MGVIEKLEPGKSIVYGDGFFSGDYNQTLSLKHAKEGTSGKPQFILTALSIVNGKVVQQGYIYFYLNYQAKTSDFIGIKVKPEYRNLNIASFLVASWIDLCMNSGYDVLGTNPKQKKPFLLYLLKKYGFEILDLSLYKTRPDIVSICKSNREVDNRKYLLFKSDEHERLFKRYTVSTSDNYFIIHSLEEGIMELDKVLLPIGGRSPITGTYRLLDDNISLAEELSQDTINKHRR